MGMRLADWLKEKDITQTEFARRIGVTSGYVSQLCAGSFWPSRRVLIAIRRVTGGAVTANDFMPNEAA